VKASFAVAVGALCLSGCLGYHIGPVKPYYLRDVHSIAIPTFTNKTLLPRIEVLVTDTVIKQFQQDGTFRIAAEGSGDATLQAEITKVERIPARFVRGNVLATREFNLNIHVKYSLVASGGQTLVGSNEVSGNTSFFVGADPTTDERQALPLATERLATNMVAQLSEGW